MRGLFFKIFIIFWIAQSLIFVISTAFILGHRFPHADSMLDPAFDNLHAESADAVKVFESSGCAGFNAFIGERHESAALADGSGAAACGQLPVNLAAQLDASGPVRAQQAGNRSLWTVPVRSASGKSYLYALSVPRRDQRPPWYDNLFRFALPQLPVALAVSGFTTFVLVLLFTRPVIRLRKAARQLAGGNLSTRVKGASRRAILNGDEFEGLAHDFNHMAERLESLVNAQRLLLRDVSHELRSPLARLSLALELSREDADATMSTHLDRIQRETERLNQLIGQLLTLSSLEAAESLDKPERVSLNQLLKEIVRDAEYEAQQRGAAVALQQHCECAVDGRRELLYRAIENVVRNAIRYTGAGSQVEIRLELDRPARTAVVEVSDRGPGIPESELQAIFAPFYRLDLARAAQTGGFGVGLAIAERAVKLHNGWIRASNRAGGGTTIQITLPIAS